MLILKKLHMKTKRLIPTLAFAGAFLTGASGMAAPIVNGFDLANFDFDITSYVDAGSSSTAEGTSGGIGWDLSPTPLWSGRTIVNGTFSFAIGINSTDNLHPSGDYTITFDQPVATLIVALSNDNLTDSINFGLTPSFAQGVSFSGTQATLNSAAGGIVFFENINSLTVQNLNNNQINDGYDLAFHAIAAVPAVPDTGSLAGYALALFGMFAGMKRLAGCRK